MTFSPAWENLYSSGRHMSVWPWSDLVSLVMRFRDRSRPARVLELGTGAGANVPLFLSMGSEYFGIEGSVTAVEMLSKQFGAKATFSVGDFCREIPFEGPFDLVIDRGSLTHNNNNAIIEALRLVHDILRPGGLFIGVTWFSPECSIFSQGEPTNEPNVRRDFAEGFLANTGVVHFADKDRMLNLFKDFSVRHLELRKTEIHLPSLETIAAWNLVAQK